MKRANRFDNHGFTLTEVMLTVAILVTLFALFMIPIAKYQKEFRQKELDSKAELVFTAVQNRMTQLQAAGMESLYAKGAGGVVPLGLVPWGNEDSRIEAGTLYYVTSNTKDTEGFAAHSIFPEGQADEELRNADWVVEFDPESGSVYAVFYGGDGMASRYTPDSFNLLRSRSNRLDDGARVGYYSGDTVEVVSTGKLEPTVEIINTDHLLLRAACPMKGQKALEFQVQIWGLDQNGNTKGSPVTVKLSNGRDGDTVKPQSSGSTLSYVATMTLDSLEDGMRFGEQSRFKNLTPGSNLKITVTVSSPDPLVDSGSESVTANSLFADLAYAGDGKTATAVVNYGRHLQNLDTASGVTDVVTQAEQRRDIDFASDLEDEWQVLYGDRSFTPIKNDNLTSFVNKNVSETGTQEFYSVIYDLPIRVRSDGGLFQRVSTGHTLDVENVRLSGTKVTGNTATGSNVGALAGKVSGTLNVRGCQVYLTGSRGHLDDKDKVFLSGTWVGGLVGRVASGGKTVIENSFASTVADAVNAAGGLVGQLDGEVTITHSYADSYLSVHENGNDSVAGGLVGVGSASAKLTVKDAYAAGFLSGYSTAGIAGMDVTSGGRLENVYAACAPLSEDGSAEQKLTYSTVLSGTGTNVYYLCDGETNALGTAAAWSGTDRAAAAAKLGEAFSAETGGLNTIAYNLKVDGLTSYTFPKLTGLTHYGDWKAEFESGALAYYEVYQSGTQVRYGFFGGNKSEQMSDSLNVVGDGYGAVYMGTCPEQVSVQVDGQTVTLTKAGALHIPASQTSDGNDYYILPLPKDVVNPGGAVSGFYKTAVVNGVTYSFNPHFAKTAMEGTATVSPTGEQTIIVRTARHLNNLSKYYGGYRGSISQKAVFSQERDLDYATYDWTGYSASSGSISAQNPIGESAAQSFIHDYNGAYHTITNVTFTGNPDYMGLFGCNAGTLRNIVLTKDVPADKTAPIIRISARLRTVYLGTLAGNNSGVINNCAVSGYQLRLQAYSASTVYAGGLVGYNSGRIRGCGADFPLIYGTSTYATVYLGGLCGGSTGQVRQSYAIGAVNVEEIKGESKGGGVTLAGFLAENKGSIRDSYCAVSQISAGAVTYGFSSTGGSATNCYYLNGGTYSFRGKIAAYDASAVSGVTAVTDDELAALRISGFGQVETSYDHSATGEGTFPYPGSVTGAGGKRVHYGDWPVKTNLGALGVFYWEYEQGGANSGYHFSYIGFENGVEKRDESLCTVHDDGGVVTEYGYGYFWKKDETEPTVTGISSNISQRKDVNAAMQKQVPGYYFASYATGEGGLQILSANDRNVKWTLNQGTVQYVYSVSPFFGCAFNYISGAGTASSVSKVEPGETDCPYQVRSVAQLQYINWSYDGGKGQTDRYVTTSTYQMFPYLQYATVTTTGKQTRWAAQAKRSAQDWQQTHDLNGASQAVGESGLAEKNTKFAPIAGAVVHATNETGYDVVLLSWFGGSYDGQSYYIENINIDSPCYNVGLFGTTAGADIKNIVLYSNNDAFIKRSTDASNWDYQGKGKPASERTYQCAYTLGGLAGIAYEYADERGKSVISNCSIAGYIIDDSSNNALMPGEATIGGLIGVSNVDLKQCSAVVDIEINCTHRWENDKGLNSAKWGNFIRVGGLVGGLRDKATDCYTGGKIVISNETLKEQVKYYNGYWYDTKNDRFIDLEKNEAVMVKWPHGRDDNGKNANPGTYVFVGGIGGSGFSSNFTNFTNQTGSTDGTPTFINCYTYVELPDMVGTITGIALIGSTADRYRYTTCSIRNCYYLESTKESVSFSKLSKTWNPGKKSMAELLATDAAKETMLKGNMNFLRDYLWEESGSQVTPTQLYGRTYDEMTTDTFKNALGDSWDWVTTEETTESGSTETVHGKYSFPGSTSELLGQDYPFPTVLRQTKNGETVNLHYGTWPLHGMFWPKGILTMDLIADYQTAENASYQTLSLKPYEVKLSDTAAVSFTYTEAGIVEAEAVRDGDGFSVKLTALKPGATEVTAVVTSGNMTYQARMVVTVTAEIYITTDPTGDISLYEGKQQDIILSAKDKNGKELPNEAWTLSSADPHTASAVLSGGNAVVTGVNEGDTAVTIQVACTLRGSTYTADTVRSVSVRMQGILGIADTAETPAYYQGTLTEEQATGFDWFKVPAAQTFTADAPTCADSTLFLYSKGTDADLSKFSLEQVTVNGAAVTEDGTQYRLEKGSIQTSGGYQVMPLHIDGRQAEKVTVAVTLQRDGKSYQLPAVSYNITEPFLHTVTYRWGSGTSQTTQTTVTSASSITLREAAPGSGTKSFRCWRRRLADGSYEEYQPGEKYPLDEDVTFEAHYQ